MFEIPQVWAGTQESLDLVLQAALQAQAMTAARAGSKDPFELPPLLTTQDGVGVIEIRGPLIAGSAGFMRLFGITGYADIQEAYGMALEDKSVKSILQVVASGGGAVEGADETSLFIRKAAAIKPVVTLAAGNMASAALWLGSAGLRRFASATSVVGSAGVMTVFMDRTEQLAKDGIKPKVFRSGKFKALGTGLEPLSSAAEQQIQDMVDGMNDVFEARLAANYGVSQKTVHDKMGQGREFLGAKAIEVGLIDGLASFDEAFAVTKILARS